METKNDIYTTQECDGQCSRCPFARDTPLGLLQENELSMLEKHTVPHHFMRKACIFTEGSTLGSVYMIRQGTVKVSIPGRQGKEHIVRMGGNGSIIGYQSILTENISPTTATAMTETDVCAISKSCFFSLLRSNVQLSRNLMSMLAREIENSQYRMFSLAYKPVPARIAESLLAMAVNYGFYPDGRTIAGPIYRKDLAEYAGVTIESTIRCLGELKKQGLISLSDKHITITDMKELETLAASE